MLSIQRPDCSRLPVKCHTERVGTLRHDQSFRLNIHRGCPHIGEQSRAVIKDGTVIVFTIALQNCDIIRMAVIVQEQRIHLEQQGSDTAEKAPSWSVPPQHRPDKRYASCRWVAVIEGLEEALYARPSDGYFFCTRFKTYLFKTVDNTPLIRT